MKVNDTIRLMGGGSARKLLVKLYGEDAVTEDMARCRGLLGRYEKTFRDSGDTLLFSSSERTEINGNHTGYSHGKIPARNINLGCVGVAAKSSSNYVHVVSKTYNQDFTIDLGHLEPSNKEAGTVDLVERLLKGPEESGYDVGGFSAHIVSNVISAAGVSSSATFGMLLYSMLNTFFNEGRTGDVAYARIGRYSEDSYRDKTLGLLDQMIYMMGGPVTTDSVEPSAPIVEKIEFDFEPQNHSLIIVQTGKGRVGLDANYSFVPNEMGKVAQYLGKEVLAQVLEEEIIRSLATMREFARDHSVLRVPHFFEENRRVKTEVAALKEDRSGGFLASIIVSGNSSWRWLQNCFANSNYQEQDTTMTLTLTESSTAGKQEGACHVHGGRFVGATVTILPNELVDGHVEHVKDCMGKDSALHMSTRLYGAICISDHMGWCESALPKNMVVDSRVMEYNKVGK